MELKERQKVRVTRGIANDRYFNKEWIPFLIGQKFIISVLGSLRAEIKSMEVFQGPDGLVPINSRFTVDHVSIRPDEPLPKLTLKELSNEP